MRFGRMLVISVVLAALQGGVLSVPARAQDPGANPLADLLNGLARSMEAEQHDNEIRRAFRAELDRNPSDRELRRYRSLMYEEHWTEADVRDDLRDRSDYRRHSRMPYENPEQVVRRAYQDVLHRDPDPEGMSHYRSLIIDKDWTERDVREDLRRSTEHDQDSRNKQADKIVRRAYNDVLGRDPDPNGAIAYRNRILDQGWDEHDVREALKRSPEYRQKNQISQDQANQIVRRAYRSVLRREPDPGARVYVDRVLRDHWTEQDVARELRNSDEYRQRHR